MDLTQESFDRFLCWLNPNQEEAGKLYESIRSSLIKRFASHNCALPDRLADLTLDRVASVLPESYVGRPEPFVNRVAYYVLKEYFAKKTEELEFTDNDLLQTDNYDPDVEAEFYCLEKCIATLPSAKQDLIRKYYRGDKATKIRLRKELAQSLNMELPVLRLQALRIRTSLKTCIEKCLGARSLKLAPGP